MRRTLTTVGLDNERKEGRAAMIYNPNLPGASGCQAFYGRGPIYVSTNSPFIPA